jgi:telomerase reverse transcriptase
MQASSIFVGRFTICTPATYLDTIAKCDIDALNRYPFVKDNPDSGENCQDSVKIQQQNEAHTTKLMMHMFPRQFSLHNVFTSPTDSNQTAQKFHDYTFREDEINKSLRVTNRSTKKALPKLPKRLRGTTRDLVRRLQILHARCSYFELLKYYCPTFLDESHENKNRTGDGKPPTASIPASGSATQAGSLSKRRARMHHTNTSALPEYKSVVELSCPTASVSAFCQAVLSKIIPDNFWGCEKDCHNKIVFFRKVDHFIKLRRFEMISLHEITQDFKVLINSIR